LEILEVGYLYVTGYQVVKVGRECLWRATMFLRKAVSVRSEGGRIPLFG